MKPLKKLVASICLMTTSMLPSFQAHASDATLVYVGMTSDRCRGNQDVTIYADWKQDYGWKSQGQIHDANDEAWSQWESGWAGFDGPTTELTWYCGDSQERAANDTPFTRVFIRRAANEKVHWYFYQ